MKEKFYSSGQGIRVISSRLKQYRINFPLTQNELAEKSGVSLRSIQNFESGKDIQFGNLIKLLNALDLGENLEMLIPDVLIRPSAYLQEEQPRKRCSKKKQIPASGEFVWGDEL